MFIYVLTSKAIRKNKFDYISNVVSEKQIENKKELKDTLMSLRTFARPIGVLNYKIIEHTPESFYKYFGFKHENNYFENNKGKINA